MILDGVEFACQVFAGSTGCWSWLVMRYVYNYS